MLAQVTHRPLELHHCSRPLLEGSESRQVTSSCNTEQRRELRHCIVTLLVPVVQTEELLLYSTHCLQQQVHQPDIVCQVLCGLYCPCPSDLPSLHQLEEVVEVVRHPRQWRTYFVRSHQGQEISHVLEVVGEGVELHDDAWDAVPQNQLAIVQKNQRVFLGLTKHGVATYIGGEDYLGGGNAAGSERREAWSHETILLGAGCKIRSEHNSYIIKNRDLKSRREET